AGAPAHAAPAERPRGALRRAVARPRGPGAARRGARRLPRRRAHVDRRVRARRGASEGARAVRVASRRAAAARDRGRQHRRRAHTAVRSSGGARRRGRGCARRVGRDVRLDDAQSRPSGRACARPAGARASAPARHRGADRGAARGRRRRPAGVPRAGATVIATRTRLDPSVFDLPVEKMRAGWYTDAYFNHTRAALLQDGRRPQVLMQVFQKRESYLGGMDEAIAILKLCADDYPALQVRALYDGERIAPYETVLTIEGDYTSFAHLETVYLGTLARRTLITTNVVHVLEASNGKPLIFMPARHDHHRVQTGDGYAAYVAGQVAGAPIGVTTDEQASWWGGRGLGTVPHALIAAYGGDTVRAAQHFADWAPEDMN